MKLARGLALFLCCGALAAPLTSQAAASRKPVGSKKAKVAEPQLPVEEDATAANDECRTVLKKAASETPAGNSSTSAIHTDQNGREIRYTRYWQGEVKVQNDFHEIADVNGVLIWEVAKFVAKSKRMPVEIDLLKAIKSYLPKKIHEAEEGDKDFDAENILKFVHEKGLNYYHRQEGAAKNIWKLFDIALLELPESFAAIREKAAYHLMNHFRQHLTMPSMEDLAEKVKVSKILLIKVIGDAGKFFDLAKGLHTDYYLDARNKIIRAYIRAMLQRDVPEHLKVQNSTPDIKEVFMALVRTATNRKIQADYIANKYTEDDFAVLVGVKDAKTKKTGFPAQVLFEEGLIQVEKEARLQSPSSFRNYYSMEEFGEQKAHDLVKVLEEKKGFLATSATAGVPLDEGMLALLLKRSEDLDYPILVYPTNQVTEGLDLRLLKNPRIHIVTHQISNAAIKIWNIPILPKNKNPFASLDQRGQFIPGQLVIVGHPQLAHRVISTGSNHIMETQQWSTGSLSKDMYPYRHPIQGRTSSLAKGYHRNSFLVVQKSDAEAGPFGEGATNVWHVRPVEYKNRTEVGGDAGFTDLGQHYAIHVDKDGNPVKDSEDKSQITVSKMDPIALAVGDMHDYVSDQHFMAVYKELLERFPSLRDVYIHDPIDGFSHNHHEDKKYRLLMEKFRKGELNIHDEVMGLVQTTNAFLNIRPNLRIKLVDSNHSYWLKTLLDEPRHAHLIVNGPFLRELQFAQTTLGYDDPLTYIMKKRNELIDSFPPDVKLSYQSHVVPVADPNRVEVLPYGRPDVIGPEDNPVHMNFHGHQGAGGKKGSAVAHSNANQNSITGDSHNSQILGGWINIGSSTPKRIGYNDGGYSGWNNSGGLVYADGTKQIFTYQQAAGTFEQRTDKDVLPADQFFGDSPLKVAPNDNDLLPNQSVMDTHTWWVQLLQGRLKPNEAGESR